MFYSTVFKAAFLSLTLLCSTTLYASPVSETTLNKFIQLSELNTLLNQSLNELQPYFDEQAEQIVQNISDNSELNAKEITVAVKLSQKMQDMTKQTITGPKATAAIKQVLKNNYTEEEIKAYNKFLETPEGKSINLKSPKVMIEIQASIEEIASQTMKNSDYEKAIFQIIAPLIQE